jgi:hypothetical protein
MSWRRRSGCPRAGPSRNCASPRTCAPAPAAGSPPRSAVTWTGRTQAPRQRKRPHRPARQPGPRSARPPGPARPDLRQDSLPAAALAHRRGHIHHNDRAVESPEREHTSRKLRAVAQVPMLIVLGWQVRSSGSRHAGGRWVPPRTRRRSIHARARRGLLAYVRSNGGDEH